jgi:hypothetical protein
MQISATTLSPLKLELDNYSMKCSAGFDTVSMVTLSPLQLELRAQRARGVSMGLDGFILRECMRGMGEIEIVLHAANYLKRNLRMSIPKELVFKTEASSQVVKTTTQPVRESFTTQVVGRFWSLSPVEVERMGKVGVVGKARKDAQMLHFFVEVIARMQAEMIPFIVGELP